MAKKDIDELIYYFDSYESATVESRATSEKCRDYVVGKQWSDAEVSALNDRGQAATVFNDVVTKVRYILGYERSSRTTVRAVPRTQEEDEGSHPITDGIRFVFDQQKWDITKSMVWENMIVEGTGGCEVGARARRNGDVDVTITHIPWHLLWYDPRSMYLDFRDAKYFGMVKWMDLEDAIETFPGKEDLLDMTIGNFTESTFTSDSSEDRPLTGMWIDSSYRRPRVKIAQVAYRVGPEYDAVWYTATYCRGGFLIDCKESPYVHPDDGRPMNPFVFQSANIDRDNNRYGEVVHYLDPQDEINHRHSKALHLMTMRQTLSERGAIDDLRRAKAELSKPDGHVVVEPGMRFEVLPTNDMAAGQVEMMQLAMSYIDRSGANAALRGRDPSVESGRAILAKQQGGITELQPTFDWLRLGFQQSVSESVWARIRQFWTAEKWIRVTDDEKNLKFVGLNRPITMYEKLIKEGNQLPPFEMLPPEIQRLAAQQVIDNDISEMDVDIILDDVPDVVSLQQEQFQALVELAPAFVQSGRPIPIKSLIMASSLRDKQEILDELAGNTATTPEEKAAAQQQQQQQQAIQQTALQLDFAQKTADVEKTRSETAKNMAAVDKQHVEGASTMAGLISDPNLPPDFTGLQ